MAENRIGLDHLEACRVGSKADRSYPGNLHAGRWLCQGKPCGAQEEEEHSVQSGKEGCSSKFTTEYRAQRAGMAHVCGLNDTTMTDLRLVGMSGCPAQLSLTHL